MEWRVIPSFPVYEASEDGQIRRVGGGVRKPHLEKNGYLKLPLYMDGTAYNQWVHRLVCEAFHGPAPFPSAEAAHENGIPLDVRESNLAWKTKAANAADKKRHGTENVGEQNGGSVLTPDAVRDLRRAYAEAPRSSGGKRVKKGTLQKLAAKHGITPNCVLAAVTGRRWSHIQ